MIEPIYLYTKDKVMICKNDIIKFLCWDSDDLTDWEFKYLVLDYNTFVYLGGGIDFGSAVGKVKTRDTIIKEIDDQDPMIKGFDLVNHVRMW